MAELDLRATKTIEEALEQIRGRARELGAGQWLTGGRFDKNSWGRWPTAADLDSVTIARRSCAAATDTRAG
jgi:predicted amidohydrolase YtcJ